MTYGNKEICVNKIFFLLTTLPLTLVLGAPEWFPAVLDFSPEYSRSLFATVKIRHKFAFGNYFLCQTPSIINVCCIVWYCDLIPTHQYLAGCMWCVSVCSIWRPAMPWCPAPAEEEWPRCPGCSTWPCLRTASSDLQQRTEAPRGLDSPPASPWLSTSMWPIHNSARRADHVRGLCCSLQNFEDT